MEKVLGIIKFGDKEVNIEGLSLYRSTPSVSLWGRFRLMDFVISNMTNSGIDNIHFHVNRKPRSVFSHVGTGRHYNINPKRGSITIMNGESEGRSDVYNTDVNSFFDNLEHVVKSSADYVLIAPSHFVYLQQYQDAVAQHVKSGADITMLYKQAEDAKNNFMDCHTLAISDEGRVTNITRNRGHFRKRNVSLECYVMKREVFIDLVREAHKTSSLYWFVDIVIDKLDELRVEGFAVESKVVPITNLTQYYKAHMDMLDLDFAREFFKPNWPILTRTSDTQPAKYGKKANVKSTASSNGADINGTVVNSFIGRNVIIEEGAIVKNSVILANSYIAKDAVLENVVVDKDASVKIVKKLVGDENNIIYVNRGNLV